MSGQHGPHMQKANRTVLAAEGISFSYRKDRPVLRDVSISVEPGRLLGILGVNGCGKSTLLSCLDAIAQPATGRVTLDGVDLASIPREERARRIAFVEQHATAGRTTVYDALLLGRKPHLAGAPGAQDYALVEEILHELELSGMAMRYVDELSGGELQKVMLGRAFVQQTDVLLLDEPTNNLDPANQHEVMAAVRHMVAEHGLGACAVLHDVNIALRYCDAFALMKRGRIVYTGGPEVITEDTLAEIYGIDCQVIEVPVAHSHPHRTRKCVVFE